MTNRINNEENLNAPKKAADKEGLAHRVGDAIESVGQKISEKGFKKVGDAVEGFGDKVEHLRDKQAPKH